MPKIKISQLPAKAANLAATDLLEVSEVSGLTYVSKKITGAELVGNRVPYTGATTNVDLGEYELKAGQLTLDVSPTGTAAVGTTRWNDSLGSSETTLKGGSVILKNGVDLVARIVNKVTPNATLTKAAYQVVRVSGAQGQRLAVAYAQANNDNNSADTLGLIIETIPTNQEGFIMTVGQIENINTTGSLQGETWADGDVLYLSPTIPGAITKVKPTGATGHIVVIGYVEYSHAINGKIYVKIMNGWELDELHNVYINPATLVNDQVLTYESATQLWKNKTLNTGITVGTTSSSGTNGRVFFQAGGVVQQDGAFNWDNTNKRLGIGANATSPTASLFMRTNTIVANDIVTIQNGQYGNEIFRVRDNATASASTVGSIFIGARMYSNGGVNTNQFDIGGYGLGGSYGDYSSNSVWLNNQGNVGDGTGSSVISVSSNFYVNLQTTKKYKFEAVTGNFGIGNVGTLGARLDVRAADGLSNPAFRVQNSVGSANLFTIQGDGDIILPEVPAGTGTTRSIFWASSTNTLIKYTWGGGSAFGLNATVNAGELYNLALGAGANATKSYAISIGNSTRTDSDNSLAIGFSSRVFANANNAITIGRLAQSGDGVTNSNNVINIGTDSQPWYGMGGENSIYLGNKGAAVSYGLTTTNVFFTHFNDRKPSTVTRDNGSFGLLGKGADIRANGSGANGTDTFMGNGGNTLVVRNHTSVPSLNITDSFQQYSADITANNAAPHFRTENGSIIKLYQNAAVTNSQGVADALTNLGLLASSTIAPTVQSVASAATVTPTFTNDLVKITAQAVALTLAAPTGTAIDGKDLMIRIKDSGSAQTIAWTSGTGGYRAIGVTLPTTTTAGKTTYVGLIYNSDDSIWDVIGVTTQA